MQRSVVPLAMARSEEHTSELQSQSNLVCRLLLEKIDRFKYAGLTKQNLPVGHWRLLSKKEIEQRKQQERLYKDHVLSPIKFFFLTERPTKKFLVFPTKPFPNT